MRYGSEDGRDEVASMPGDVPAWTRHFWAHVVRLDGTWTHSELAGHSAMHDLAIDSSGGPAGSIVASHLWAGERTTIGRHDFTLAESPLAAARDVLRMFRECRREHGIDVMRRDAFIQTVRHAEAAADDAVRLRETLEMWADRLLPLLDADPTLTVGEALAHYNAAEDRKV